MPQRTYIYISAALLIAATSCRLAFGMGSQGWLAFGLLLLACVCSSGLKVELPNTDGTMSATFPFILIGLIILSPFQAMVLAALSVAAQRRKGIATLLMALQLSFNMANAMVATALAYAAFAALQRSHMPSAPALALASVAYFVWNTGAVAVVIASSTGSGPYRVWHDEFRWYLPFYILGAVLASTAHWLNVRFGWATALLLVPAVYTLYRAYTSQIAQMKERKHHLEETEALHLRIIEGLSMAIEAKDQNTHDHLFRVRAYVQAVGTALELDKLAMQALQTAAFLHDIGKLAVPEHIVNKPGKLTPEEFEKMKIHPVVGADILERVRFPYPVVPIVRSHHEWWNGTGYPDGLRGEQIPIGARILTVVDCFDAMVSDRPYRQGMGSEKALGIIRELAGKQFDPDIVAAFERCHTAAELQAELQTSSVFTALNTEIEVARGHQPGAGFEGGSNDGKSGPPMPEVQLQGDAASRFESLRLVAEATQEAQTFFDLSRSLCESLSPEETVAVMASRLQRLVPHDLIVIYLRHGDTLTPRFLYGACARHFTQTPLALGEGVSGWVAQSAKPLLNGNAAIEPGCAKLPSGVQALQSALAVPLFDGQGQVSAVLTLYSVKEGSFGRGHLRILQAMEPKLSSALGNVLQFRPSGGDAETDVFTGLPNARRLFLQLEAELDRCRTADTALTLILCELNGPPEETNGRVPAVGEHILSLIAREFQLDCEAGHTLARMGADQLALLLPNIGRIEASGQLEMLRRSVDAVSRRMRPGIQIGTGFGAAFYPEDGTSAERLLAAADRRISRERRNFDQVMPPERVSAGEAISA